jgi:hypothetical protein
VEATVRRRASLEERIAWDQYAAAWSVALGFSHQERSDGEEDPVTAAAYADDMLKERRKRFGNQGPRRARKRKRDLARLNS